jgi:hypothetical protein
MDSRRKDKAIRRALLSDELKSAYNTLITRSIHTSTIWLDFSTYQTPTLSSIMSRYSAAHVNPQGANDSRPTALQIIHDEQMEDKLVGKAVVITGVSSGLGVETARALAATGATLYLTARDLEQSKECT